MLNVIRVSHKSCDEGQKERVYRIETDTTRDLRRRNHSKGGDEKHHAQKVDERRNKTRIHRYLPIMSWLNKERMARTNAIASKSGTLKKRSFAE